MGRIFKKRTPDADYTPVPGDTFENIVDTKCEDANPKITWQEVALFNWGTKEPAEVARALVELLGVRKWDDPDPNKWELDPARGTGKKLSLPKVMQKKGLSLGKTHRLKIKQQLPATAVSITALDKWFLPGEEACNISWQAEGLRVRAKKLDFDVYASNYCKATATNQNDFVDYTYADTPDVPIRQKAVSGDVAERDSDDIDDWQGESEAADGVLKPRPPETRYINAASSPYTVMLRYYRSNAHKTALLRVQSFWPRWSGTGGGRAVVADSLKIKFHLKNCPGNVQGQFLIYDKDFTLVWRQAIPEAKCANGDQEIDWSADGRTVVTEDKMPYRVQIQVHTNKDTSPGLGLAAMHTEVRVYCHPDTATFGANGVDHEQETQVLQFKLPPWLPGPAPAEDSAKGRKLRLAKAGYHPGPVMDGEAQPDYIRAIQEFQRDHQKVGANTRLRNDGTIDQDTKDAIAAQAADRRPLFADSARADLTTTNAIETLVNTKDGDMVAWVDDRHFYTEPSSGGPVVYPDIDLANYRGKMAIGDAKQTTDAATICRPWLPVEAAIPIMRKADDLGGAAVPAINDFTRKAAGPLRVDWTFRDLPMADNVNTALYESNRARPKKALTDIITALHGAQNGKDAFNCPDTTGGLRGANYYRVPFGYGTTDSLAPWTGFDDAGNTVVCSVAHDDLGQDANRVFATHLGKAGIYLRPSIIAGDGYQFRAQVNFRDLPGGAATHPNWKVLRDRYTPEKLPQAHSAKVRLWRKTSLRGYIPWEVNADRFWGNGRNYETLFRVYFEPCFVHFVLESSGGAPVFTPDTLFPAGAGEAAYRTLIANNTGPKGVNVKTDTYQPAAAIVRSTAYVWPWSTHKHLGINSVPPPGTAVGSYYDVHLYPNNGTSVFDTSWRMLRVPLIHEAIRQIEKTQGVMRGHTIGEFRASPQYWVEKYYCDTCSTDQLLIELTNAGGSAVGEDCRAATCAGHLITGAHRVYRCNRPGCNTTTNSIPDLTGQPCTRTCAGTLSVSSPGAWLSLKKKLFDSVKTQYKCNVCNKTRDVVEPANNTGTSTGVICAKPCRGTFQPISPVRTHEIGEYTDMMGFPAAGESMGGLWLFCTYGRGVSTWGHEIAHHKHLAHAPGGGGYVPAQHDAAVSTLPPLNGFPAGKNGWDRVCLMGYVRTGAGATDVDRGYFCGKCILKLRGWIVETGGVHTNCPAGNVTGP